MILTCPECATRYQTDASLFPPEGRKVRCAKCGHVWFQAAPAPEHDTGYDSASREPEHVPEDISGPGPAPDLAPPQRSAFAPSLVPSEIAPQTAASAPAGAASVKHWGEFAALGAGWAALAAILILIGWSFVRYREDVATYWPQTASLYRAIGYNVNTRGLAFDDRSARYVTENGQDVLVISGRLTNITSHELAVPPIRIGLVDADKHEVYHWNVKAGVATLAPGQTTVFHTQLPSPPPEARDIELRFDEPKT